MKYFDTLTEGVKEALENRGVDTEKLLYCLKCDMNGEGLYYDTYLVFDEKSLYSVSGYDRMVQEKKKYRTEFEFKEYAEYKMTELKELYVDRYRHTCRLMGKLEINGGSKGLYQPLFLGFFRKDRAVQPPFQHDSEKRGDRRYSFGGKQPLLPQVRTEVPRP